MTYIEYLNAFNQWLETNALPTSSQLMYYKLLHVFNRAGWPEDVGVDNLRLMLMTDIKSESTVIRAREKLVEAGALKGTAEGVLNVSEDFCRTMTVLDRLGKLE